jgi:hypothetical protein
MQYILTQEELDALKTTQKSALRLTEKKLQTLCTKICNEMPIKWGWGGPDPKPWGCILSTNDDADEWYCDKCPVVEICPSNKKCWSK